METDQQFTANRQENGRFGPGNSGRPKGSRNRLNGQVLDKLGDLSSEALMVLRQKLTEGDLRAATYVLDRFLPASRLVEFESTHPDAIGAALAEGTVTPTEAAKASSAVSSVIASSDVIALRERLDQLEAEIAAHRGG